MGMFSAYEAKTGKKVWSYDLKSGIVAPPITYMVDGEQYITVAVGWGGVMGQYAKFTESIQPGRIFTFKINGKAKMPALIQEEKKTLLDVPVTGSPSQVAHGQQLFMKLCDACHNLAGGGTIPNLTYSKPEIIGMIEDIVKKGIFVPKGMPSFGDRVSSQDVKDIQQYIYSEAAKKKK
jgi:quinohemoprotein ethanol dehydrogenase